MSASHISLHSGTMVAQSTTTNKSNAHHHQFIPVDRLPSFIQLPTQITELVMTPVPSGLLKMIGMNTTLLSNLRGPLQATVDKLMNNIPAPWKKVNC